MQWTVSRKQHTFTDFCFLFAENDKVPSIHYINRFCICLKVVLYIGFFNKLCNTAIGKCEWNKKVFNKCHVEDVWKIQKVKQCTLKYSYVLSYD